MRTLGATIPLLLILMTGLLLADLGEPNLAEGGGLCSAFHYYESGSYQWHQSAYDPNDLDHSHGGTGPEGSRTNGHESMYIDFVEDRVTGCPYGDHSLCWPE